MLALRQSMLIDLFQANGWRIECETPCRYFVNQGRVNLLADGRKCG